MKVKSESEVAQSCPTLSDPMDCSLPGSTVHGIFQARVGSGVPSPSPKHRKDHSKDARRQEVQYNQLFIRLKTNENAYTLLVRM